MAAIFVAAGGPAGSDAAADEYLRAPILDAGVFAYTSYPEQLGASEVSVEQSKGRYKYSWSRPAEDAVDMNLDLSYAVDDADPLPIATPIEGEGKAQTRELLSMKGTIGFSDVVNIEFRHKIDNRFDWTTGFVGIEDDDLLARSPNQFVTTDVSVGFAKDRLRLTRRVNWSDFDQSRFDFDGDNDESLFSIDDETGMALLERVDATLWRSDNLSFSVFGLRNTVNADYQTFDDDKKKKKKEDPLEVANRVTYKYGAVLDVGPLSLNVAEFMFEPQDGGADPRERGYETGVSLNLVDLRGRASADMSKSFWSIAPTSIWMKYSESEVDPSSENVAPEDATSDLSVGGTWTWNKVYGNVSYWRSSYDSRQIDAEDADWAGDGIDLSAGYSQAHWGVNTSLSLGRYHTYGAWSESAENSYDGSLGFWVDRKELPGLKASLSLGRYSNDDLVYNGDNLSDYLKLGFAVDFSKYLRELENETKRSMKLYYGLDYALDRDQSTSAQQSSTDHIVFLRYSTGM